MSNLKNTRTLTTAGMLAALTIVLKLFAIPLSPALEIRFMSIPIAIAGTLFGPVVGGIVGAIGDLGGFMVRPSGEFFVGFTISSALAGVIFGLMLYRQKISWQRILITQIIYAVVIGILLNTYLLTILIGKAFIPLMIARAWKVIIMIPINTILVYYIMKVLVSLGLKSQIGE